MKLNLTTLCENTAGRIGIKAEWGWSILIETDHHRILVDAGAECAALQNADLMKVRLDHIDKVLLSHAHQDHSGGLRNLFKRTGPLAVIAHPSVWEDKFATDPEGVNLRYTGIPYAKNELEKMTKFMLKKGSVNIGEHIMTTGEIPMVTEFEEPAPNFWVKTKNGLRRDSLKDDQAIIVKHPKGLVVVLGCAHRGMINTLLHARKITGEDRVYTVVGGTHLYSKSAECVEKTVKALKDMRVERVGVSHCTGFFASKRISSAFGSNFFMNNAGNVIEL